MSIKSNKQRKLEENIAVEAARVLAQATEQFLKDAKIPDHGYFLCIFEKDHIGHVNMVSNVPIEDMILALRDGANQLEQGLKKNRERARNN